MDRRSFVAGALAAAALPAGAGAAPFASRRFTVRVVGRGPDVVLIPGLTSSRAVWNGLIGAVPGYRYHLVQIAGFAGDPVGGNAQGPVLGPLTDELARYMAAAGLLAPAIVGHSMGGTLAMLLALRFPRRIGRIMVVDMLPAPAGLFGSTAASVGPLADALFETLTRTEGGQRLLQNLVGGGRGPAAARSDPNFVARVTRELARTDLTDDLPAIRAPITVVYATPTASRNVDPRITVQAYRTAYSGAPTARLVRVPDSGHLIMADQPVRFAAAVREFLR